MEVFGRTLLGQVARQWLARDAMLGPQPPSQRVERLLVACDEHEVESVPGKLLAKMAPDASRSPRHHAVTHGLPPFDLALTLYRRTLARRRMRQCHALFRLPASLHDQV